MNYYYDILINFQDNYCMFYEWDKEDNIEFIKKMPLIHIKSKVFIDFLLNKFKVSKDFLNKIENKTKIKQNEYLKYSCVFSDGKNNLAIEFNDDGISLNKSSVMLEDEININEFMYTINISEIGYEIIKEDKLPKETRQELKVKKLLEIEIKSMYFKKEFSKLKYIYLEWFNELLDNIDKMYDNMLNKIKEKLTEKEYHIYELIKLSYNNV